MLGQRAYHADDALALGRGEACQRFIQQQQFGPRREGHADLHQALSAVGEAGYLGAFHAFESEKAHQRVRFLVHSPQCFLGAPGIEAFGGVRLHSQAQVLEHGQTLEQVRNLKRARDAQRGEAVGASPFDRLPGEAHAAGLRNVHARKNVEQSGLAGAIGADQRLQPCMPQADTDIAHRLEVAETLAYAFGGEQHRFRLGRLRLQQARGHLLRRTRLYARCHRGKRFGLLAPWREQSFAETDQTRGREQDECHEQQTEPEHPACGVAGQDLAEQDIEGGAERGAHEAAAAADDGHRQNFTGEIRMQGIRRGEQFKEGKQRAAEAGDRRRQGERRELVAPHRVSSKSCALLVLAHGRQNRAERGIHHPPHYDRDGKDDCGAEVIEHQLLLEIEAQHGRSRNPSQTGLAAGNVGPAEPDRESERRECECEQGEIDAAPAKHQKSHRGAEQAGRRHAEQQRQQQAAFEPVNLRECGGVGGKAEEQAVAERQQAGVA